MVNGSFRQTFACRVSLCTLVLTRVLRSRHMFLMKLQSHRKSLERKVLKHCNEPLGLRGAMWRQTIEAWRRSRLPFLVTALLLHSASCSRLN